MGLKKAVTLFGLCLALVCGMTGCNSADNKADETVENVGNINHEEDSTVSTSVPSPEPEEIVPGPTAEEVVADIVIGWNF